jgi:hypothetical protein
MSKYRDAAEAYIKLLIKNEKASTQWDFVEQGSESELQKIWKNLFSMDKAPSRQPEIIAEWNLWN